MEIDNLKILWQNENKKKSYESDLLLKMINKKSTNYIKYILWISIAEFSIVILINIFTTLFDNQSERFFSLFTEYHIPFTANLMQNYNIIFKSLNVITLIISCIFIYLFYISYKNIRIESSIKQFIEQIVKVKNTVNLFISINLGIILLIYLFFVFYPIYLVFIGQIIMKDEILKLTGIIVFTIILSLVFLYVYYKIIYGIVLNKLVNNLKELNKIERNQNLSV